jgi:threonine/homoserine/homoserine lactone efflux protein
MEYLPIILFAVSTCVTPGPNNIMIMTSGLNYGIKKSLQHLLGIYIGFPLMILVVGLGVSQIFEDYPILHVMLKLGGASYLTYLAMKIAVTPISKIGESKGKPFSFLQAALFQWVNPKAWVLAVGATVTFTALSGSYTLQVMSIALIFMIFGSPCTFLWLWFGVSLKSILQNPLYVRAFNCSMALLLLASLFPVFIDLYNQFLIS